MAQIRPVWDRIVDQGLIFQPGPLENTPGMTMSYIKNVGVKPMKDPDPSDLGAPLYHEEDALVPGKAPRTWGAKGTEEFYSPSKPVDHVITVPGYNDNGRWVPERKEPRKLVRDKDGNVLSLSVDEYNMFPKWVAAGANGRRGNVSDYTELPDEFLSNLVEEQPKVQRSTDLQATPVQTPYKPIAPEPVLPQLEEPEVMQAESVEPPPPVFPGVYPLVKNKNGFSNVKLETRAYGKGANRRHYVIPTMENGKALTSKQIDAMVKQHGLDKFPSFATKKEADEWSKTNHAMIDVDGRLRGTAWTQAEADAYFAKNQPAQQTAAPTTNAAPVNGTTPTGGTGAPVSTVPTSTTAPTASPVASSAPINYAANGQPTRVGNLTVTPLNNANAYVNDPSMAAGEHRSMEQSLLVRNNDAYDQVDAINADRLTRYERLKQKIAMGNADVRYSNSQMRPTHGGHGYRRGAPQDSAPLFEQPDPEAPKLELYPEDQKVEYTMSRSTPAPRDRGSSGGRTKPDVIPIMLPFNKQYNLLGINQGDALQAATDESRHPGKQGQIKTQIATSMSDWNKYNYFAYKGRDTGGITYPTIDEGSGANKGSMSGSQDATMSYAIMKIVEAMVQADSGLKSKYLKYGKLGTNGKIKLSSQDLVMKETDASGQVQRDANGNEKYTVTPMGQAYINLYNEAMTYMLDGIASPRIQKIANWSAWTKDSARKLKQQFFDNTYDDKRGPGIQNSIPTVMRLVGQMAFMDDLTQQGMYLK